jgi:hypothetical protein
MVKMEIQNPQTGLFLPLQGAFNFRVNPSGIQGIPEAYTFGVDWTQGGEGQEILREHIRSKSLLSVKHHGQLYAGVVEFTADINSPNGAVMVRKQTH